MFANGRLVFLINELNSTVTSLAYDPTRGTLTEVQTVSALPPGYTGNWPRDFILDPTGTYLLVANQKSNNVVSFKRDATTGRLTALSPALSLTAPTSLLVATSPV